MRNYLNVFFLFVVSAAVMACANETGSGIDPSQGTPRLVYVSSQTNALGYSTMANLVVRYEYDTGVPIQGATLNYTLDGVSAGSVLAATQGYTNANGEATIALTTGTSPTNFRVVVTPPVGSAVSFAIGVSDSNTGSIAAVLNYGGTRAFNPIQAFLYRGTSCAVLNPNALPTALSAAAAVSTVTERPAFPSVEENTGYTVAVTGRVDGTVRGWGCTENITVRFRQETQVPVTLRDIEQDVSIIGTFDLDNRLDLAGALPPRVAGIVSALDELTDDNNLMGDFVNEDYGQDPGAFVTDFAMRQFCRWECPAGTDYDSCDGMEINHELGDLRLFYEQNFSSWDGAQRRYVGTCGIWETLMLDGDGDVSTTGDEIKLGWYLQNYVNQELERYLPDFVSQFAAMVGDLARVITDAHIKSVLTVQNPAELGAPITHELLTLVVNIRNWEGTMVTREVSLTEIGLSGVRTAATAQVVGNIITLPAHSFTMPYGQLVLYLYNNVLLPLIDPSYTSTASILTGLVDCEAIGMRIAESTGLAATTAQGLCNAGVATAGAAVDGYITSLVEDDGLLTLQGSATGGTLDSNRRATTLDAGTWTGSWGEDGMSGDVTGTFTGILRP